ncbi:MAG: sigma 54-interacting transcriptional regulator [Desulfobacterales bacterium]|nr:sigma 54-interacting transcriptional regulator [Desulfobacterales bacterium]
MSQEAKEQTFIQCNQWLEILEELNIGAFTADFNRRVRAMNYSAQALMGLKESEVVGTDCREVFWGVPCLVECLIRGDDTGEGIEPDVTIGDETDHKYLVTRVATPIFNHNHEMVGCLTILQDHSPIADLINRVQYDERNMKIVLDNLDVGIFTVNRGGLITFFNTAAEKILGYTRDQLLGGACHTIFHGDPSPDVNLLKASIADGKPRRTPNGRMVTVHGVTVPISANYMAMRNEKGSIVGGLATFHDLTLIHRLTQAVSDRYTYHDMVGKSPAMKKIFEMVSVVAETDATILIQGATGTGKDILAKVIHSMGKRSEKPFVKVNCAAIPDNLLESELFGYARGAFTGAHQDKPGRFELADQGTIFLDEIGDIPISLQAKLLRVLEDREFYPLGSRRTRKVDVRIISATNRELEKRVAQGLFREDLFYRLNVMQIKLPLLKDRREDLPLLIPHIVRKLSASKENPPTELSKAVMDVLLNHDYPGNIRELENILEHALIICRGDMVKPEHLPVFLQNRDSPEKAALSVAHRPNTGAAGAEREEILQTLGRFNGHKTKTAQSLGIDRTTLWRKMKKFGLAS